MRIKQPYFNNKNVQYGEAHLDSRLLKRLTRPVGLLALAAFAVGIGLTYGAHDYINGPITLGVGLGALLSLGVVIVVWTQQDRKHTFVITDEFISGIDTLTGRRTTYRWKDITHISVDALDSSDTIDAADVPLHPTPTSLYQWHTGDPLSDLDDYPFLVTGITVYSLNKDGDNTWAYYEVRTREAIDALLRRLAWWQAEYGPVPQ